MAGESVTPPPGGDYPFGPVKLVLAGAAVVAAAWVTGLAMPDSLLAIRFAVVAVGLAMVGAGLAAHWPHVRWDAGDLRVGSAVLVLVAAGAAWLSCETLSKYADSLALVARNAGILAAFGALLVAVPDGPRKALASLLIAFHFGVIMLGTTVVQPPPGGPPPWTSPQIEVRQGGRPPWLGVQLMFRYGRSYLQFLQMYNAYHFYAPEPGPTTLLWFRVAYEDGGVRWIKIPDHAAATNELERRRFGMLATALQAPAPVPLTPEKIKAREDAGKRYNPPLMLSPTEPPQAQYREPDVRGKMLLSNYVRFIAREAEHPEGRDAAAKAVRVYKLDYHNPPANILAAGISAHDPELYEPFFLGEYAPDGKLVESSLADLGYWRLPIFRVPPDDLKDKPEHERNGKGRVVNGLRLHAGEADKQETMP